MFQVSKLVLKQVSYVPTRLHIFDQKYSENSNIVKYYYNLKYIYKITVNTIIKYVSYDGKAEFSAAMNIQCNMILQKSF